MRWPPSTAGAFQERSIREVPSALADSAVGLPGTVDSVVACATRDDSPVPIRLIADTR